MPSATAVPIAVASPVFAEVQAVAVPSKYSDNPALTPEIWGIFENMQSITIRQHVKLLPKKCCACPPCVKQENTYSVYAGVKADAEGEILRIDEVSDDWNRCCCAPYHPLKLEVRQYIPLPGTQGVSDFSFLAEDFRRDFGTFTGYNKQQLIHDYYKSQPVLFTFQRKDGQRCCAKMPCKWLDTFVCFDCCRDGVDVYAGNIPDPEKEKGRPNPAVDTSKLVGSAIQPNFGGFCIPTLHLRGEGEAEDATPFGKVEGPCFFGGWSEMCCNFRFFVSNFTSKAKEGDIAVITKKKPSSLTGAFVELFSNADVYGINFNSQLNASQKVTVLASQILADYMFFDGNTEKCSQDDDFVYCYCCYFSFIGAICPIYICIPKKIN